MLLKKEGGAALPFIKPEEDVLGMHTLAVSVVSADESAAYTEELHLEVVDDRDLSKPELFLDASKMRLITQTDDGSALLVRQNDLSRAAIGLRVEDVKGDYEISASLETELPYYNIKVKNSALLPLADFARSESERLVTLGPDIYELNVYLSVNGVVKDSFVIPLHVLADLPPEDDWGDDIWADPVVQDFSAEDEEEY